MPLENFVAGQKRLNWSYKVQTRAAWGAATPWVNRPYMQPLRAVDVVGPAIGQATFQFVYGRIKREDTNVFAQEIDEEIRDHFIRVIKVASDLAETVLWTGIINAERIKPGGGDADAGIEIVEAFALTQLLDREEVRQVKAKLANGTNAYIDELPTFNRRWKNGGQVYGNRSTTADVDGAHVFSPDGEVWSFKTIAEMLLKRHAPANGPTWVLGGQSSALDELHDVVEYDDGDSVWKIINEMIRPARGFGIAPIVSGETVTLYVYTTTAAAVTVGGVTIPANTLQDSLNLDLNIDLVDPEMIFSTADKYEKVVLLGDEIVSCFSLSYQDGTLQEGFNNTGLLTEYHQAALGTNGYSTLPKEEGNGLTDATKAERNDNYRKDDKFATLWSKHRLSANWDGLVGNGEGGPKVPALPKCKDDGTLEVLAATSFFPMGKRFEEHLPFEEHLDYSVNPPDVTKRPTNSEDVYLRPFALVKRPGGTFEYYYVDKPSEAFEHASANFAIYPRELAVKVEPQIPHMYGNGSNGVGYFNETTAEPFNERPAFNYKRLVVTVALKTSYRLRKVANIEPITGTTLTRVKTIELPAKLWFVAPNTVLGVNKDLSLKRYAATGSGIVRDDREKLDEIAAAAVSWFGVDRGALTVSWRQINAPPQLGTLILGSFTGGVARVVNSPITSIGYDFGRTPKVTIETNYAELDFSSFFNRNG